VTDGEKAVVEATVLNAMIDTRDNLAEVQAWQVSWGRVGATALKIGIPLALALAAFIFNDVRSDAELTASVSTVTKNFNSHVLQQTQDFGVLLAAVDGVPRKVVAVIPDQSKTSPAVSDAWISKLPVREQVRILKLRRRYSKE